MSNTLSSVDFGKKLYNTLPPSYRVDDALVEYSLERYLSALSDGGFAKVIEEINGLLTLVDPDKIKSELLPILFKQYGFEIFNGIPEIYLRKLLPVVSELNSLKGTKTAVEYLTSIISGVKSTIEYDEEFSENRAINVRLEMDYEAEGNKGLPDTDQLLRIIQEYVPFFCDVLIVYVYLFSEACKVDFNDSPSKDSVVVVPKEDATGFSMTNIIGEGNSVFGASDVFGDIIFGTTTYKYRVESSSSKVKCETKDTTTFNREESSILTQSELEMLAENSSLNNVVSCDKITVNAVTTKVFLTPTGNITV